MNLTKFDSALTKLQLELFAIEPSLNAVIKRKKELSVEEKHDLELKIQKCIQKMKEIVSEFSDEDSIEEISTILSKIRTINSNIKNQNYNNVKKVA